MFHDAKNVRENGAGLVELGRRRALDQIIGNSDQTFQIKERIRMISGSVSSVLITGEEGVDKELYARVIHQESDRVNQPMITVNCSAIPEGDLEKELFGMARNSQNEMCIRDRYISAAGERYGLLLNDKLETLARLPGLCDTRGDMAVFDYESGNLRQCRLYSLQELKALGEIYIEEKEERSDVR